MEDRELLETILKALVDHPDTVRVVRSTDDLGVLLSVDVHKEDMGKVIGKAGNTAKSIRTIMRVAGMKHNARVNVKVNEPVAAPVEAVEEDKTGIGGGIA